MSIELAQVEAAKAICNMAIERLRTNNGVHAETAIFAAAGIAGTWALRSCGLPMETLTPGTAIFSEVSDERGQHALRVVTDFLAGAEIPMDKGRMHAAPASEHEPHLTLIEIQTRLEPACLAIAENHSLTGPERTEAAALATAMLIRMCVQVLDPTTAYAIAIAGLVGGCKTVPLSLERPMAAMGRE